MEEKGKENGVPGNAALEKPAPAPEIAPVEGGRRRAGGNKRKASANSGENPKPSKRAAKEKTLPPHLQSLNNGPCTRARQSPNKLAAAAAASQQRPPEKIPSQFPPAGGESVPACGEAIVVEEDRQVTEPNVEAEFEAIKSRDAISHVIPTPAGWFSWTKIHPLEEHALKSFFNGKSEGRTPEVYMEIRNAIMKKFHMDPQTQVEPKDFSELSVGDLEARQEVFEFLDHWGLINFHPFPPPEASSATTDADGAAKTASLIEKLYHFEMTESCPQVGRKADISATEMPLRLLPESSLADDMVRPEGPSVEYHCNSCSADCSRKRYHCQTQADFDLCSECYNDGKFDSGMVPADFILMESGEVPGASGGSWTDQETLLLLEALELYGENWNEIAEHVATKTKTQCILHFVQMPIEDPFLESMDDIDGCLPGNMDQELMKKDVSAVEVAAERPETEKDLSAVEVAGEKTESRKDLSPKELAGEKADVGKDSSAVEVAGEKTETGKDSLAVEAAEERTEIKSTDQEDQPRPSPTDMSKPGDEVMEVVLETGPNVALDALKAAFQVFGSLPSSGELLSFAESGNPVMTLAAFLAGLVEPDVAAASARSALKAMSEDSPGIQLATRHCFFLEDPPDDKKDPPISESVDVDMVPAQTTKEEDKKVTLKDSEISKDPTDKNNENAVSMETESTVVSEEKVASEQKVASEEKVASEDKDPEKQQTDKPVKLHTAESSNSGSVEAVISNPLKEPDSGELALHEEVKPNVMVESKDLASTLGVPPSAVKESGDLASSVEVTPGTSKETGDVTPVGDDKQNSEATTSVGIVIEPVPPEEKGSEQTVGSKSTTSNGENIGESDIKVLVGKSEKNTNRTEKKDEHNIDKIKHAAITALSAASVKAKLLANQEEDEVRQLAAFLIEKQLHKLETKLSLFAEMEGVTMRIREQLDRARRGLFNERAQIIATRLGFPGSSSRPMPSSLPMNKIATNYATIGSKAPSMTSQRPPSLTPQKPLIMTSQSPPVKKTMRTPMPPGSTYSGTVAGNSNQALSQDTLSSVGRNLGS